MSVNGKHTSEVECDRKTSDIKGMDGIGVRWYIAHTITVGVIRVPTYNLYIILYLF